MLIIEVNSNGTRRVVLHKDWHPGRVSLAYIPKPKNYVEGQDMYRLQKALLKQRKQRIEPNVGE